MIKTPPRIGRHRDTDGGEWTVISAFLPEGEGHESATVGTPIPDNFSPTLALRMVERGRKSLEADCVTDEALRSCNATADWLSAVLQHLMPIDK